MSFGELVERLWQADSEALEPKVVTKKKRKPTTKGKRAQKS
jgi:hypothetical protein